MWSIDGFSVRNRNCGLGYILQSWVLGPSWKAQATATYFIDKLALRVGGEKARGCGPKSKGLKLQLGKPERDPK